MFRMFVQVLALALCLGHAAAQQPAPAALRAVAFEGGWNIGVWAAQRQGFFEASGVSVQLTYTPNSAALVTGLYDGRYDLSLIHI